MCHGCRDSDERCRYCGRTSVITHGVPHDMPTNLPTTGRTKEESNV